MSDRFCSVRPIFRPFMIIGGVILAGGLALLFGLFIMLLWNWLMPAIFELPEITYWQGWGIAVLAHLLFKAGAGHHRSDNRKRKDPFWKKEFKDKVEESYDTERGPFSEIGDHIRSEIRKEFEKEFEKDRKKRAEKEARDADTGSPEDKGPGGDDGAGE